MSAGSAMCDSYVLRLLEEWRCGSTLDPRCLTRPFFFLAEFWVSFSGGNTNTKHVSTNSVKDGQLYQFLLSLLLCQCKHFYTPTKTLPPLYSDYLSGRYCDYLPLSSAWRFVSLPWTFTSTRSPYKVSRSS